MTVDRLEPALLVFVLLALAGCDGRSPSGRIGDLADRYWEWWLEAHPVEATYLGDHRFGARMPDVGPEARRARRERRRALLEELSAIDRSALRGQDRLTHRALEETLRTSLAVDSACRFPVWEVNHRDGPPASLLSLADVQPLETRAQAEAMVERWRAMGPYLRQVVENLRDGLEAGLVSPRSPVELTLRQLEDALAEPDSAWPLLDPLERVPGAWPDSARRRFGERLRGAVAERVRPAFVTYRDFLRDELLPRAREGEAIGVSSLPGGEECYGAAIREHTSLGLSPREIHDFGRQEIARIGARMRELGSTVFGTDDLSRIQSRLRSDPRMHFDSAAGVLRKAREATDRARGALPEWFGRLPETPVVVEPIPAHEAPYTTVAYYRRPAADGSRPGTYFVNTYRPETRTRYEAEVLAFHEGIPGHHLQIALAQELEGIPEFRKHQGSTAFVEGWALYTERLADEMGLYSGDVDRLGMLSFDAWRAVRLVVDTGIHAFGWTRERAVRYMLDHTLLARNNVENEIDRYIAWPGQALAYKLGQREILRLRERAREATGEEFRIEEFHDRVLENGAVTLSLLRDAVDAWIEDAGTDAEPAAERP